MRSTVTLHVVSSLDGFIAKKDNSVSWMDSSGDVYERGVTDDDAEVIQSIDCYVLGSRTYEHALQLGWPYGDTPTVVMTNRELPSTRESVEIALPLLNVFAQSAAKHDVILLNFHMCRLEGAKSSGHEVTASRKQS